MKRPFLLFCMLQLFLKADCPDGFLEFDDVCYFKAHYDVLQDFVDENESLRDKKPEEIGFQEWKDGRLLSLYLSHHELSTIPGSIGLLKNLIHLDISRNNMISLPEGICDIYPYHTQVELSQNKICPPYPYCFEYIGDQDVSRCEEFSCPKNYTEIEGECYVSDHIQSLQEIINSNPSLREKQPLQLGKDIGNLEWMDGRLTHLNLVSHELISLPDAVCNILPELEFVDFSYNQICPPYPFCIEYLSRQNQSECLALEKTEAFELDSSLTSWELSPPVQFRADLDGEGMESDLEVLQSIIDNNPALIGTEPLNLGKQRWENMRLFSLDLSQLDITYLPAEICRLLPQLKSIALSGNAICPPYPTCFDYVGNQKQDVCGRIDCPTGYTKIAEECYFTRQLEVIEKLKTLNPALHSKETLEVGTQKWQNGKLEKLILSSLKIDILPDSFCLLSDVQTVEISNNKICPPYPQCLREHHVGYQEIDHCLGTITCPPNHVTFDNHCYFYNDLQVLIDISRANEHLSSFHPLLLGHQVWKNNRLQMLYLNHLEISYLPASISKLDNLQYLYLNDNQLETLPESLCEIYPTLKGIELGNNKLCPPYLECFQFIGSQNTQNCEHQFCPYGYTEINEKCYWENDILVLKDFIEKNNSLNGRLPLEIGVQKWQNMRLDFLYLGVNNLTDIPESICNIYENMSEINISGNKICPPYPACVEEYMGEQDTSGCP
ncbi:MAG: hypothetical protein QGF36_01285 [Candidatus Marinimicrobia bacterium]|nr:hypothetical protein [Candidatus Neomarinimicrobiota bacterium]